MPVAGKRYLVFQSSMYSALPTNQIWRGSRPMSSAESRNEMWFGAMMHGPDSGMRSSPVIFVFHRWRDAGPMSALANG